MYYKDLKELAYAWSEVADPPSAEEIGTFQDLFQVYYAALNKPPEGVIGVGAITYAEFVLQEYQKGTSANPHQARKTTAQK